MFAYICLAFVINYAENIRLASWLVDLLFVCMFSNTAVDTVLNTVLVVLTHVLINKVKQVMPYPVFRAIITEYFYPSEDKFD